MRGQRFLLIFCLACLPLHAARTRIDAVEPGTITLDAVDDTHIVLLVSGAGLKGITGCTLTPVLRPEGASDTPKICDIHEYIPSTGQARVAVGLSHNWKSGKLVLTLTAGREAINGKAAANIHTLGIVYLQATKGGGKDEPPAATPATGNSSQTSPFAGCINANVASSSLLNPPPGSAPLAVNCASSLLRETEVKDNFGQHVAHTYYAVQVRISNDNANYDFLLRDILLTLPDGRVISGRIRRFAQGVAVKGKSLDRRAAWYDSLQAGSTLYGALTVFASTGFKTAGNVLAGSFLAGFAQIFPDYTADNVNRFNNAVFDDQNPSIVPKNSIGQPPLYVVALVPKDINPSEAYAKRIAVSLEGTYIRQVSLVTLSTTSLTFPATFISPDQLAGLNPDPTAKPSAADELEVFRSAGKSQSFTISNSNSSPMNITKLEITPITKSYSKLSASEGDFSFDRSNSDCGKTNSQEFDPTKAFTLLAQTFCTVSVKFHPAGIGDSSATFSLEGSSLDGPRTIALTGKSIGLIIDTHHISFEDGLPSLPTTPAFTCVAGSPCALDMKMVGAHKRLLVPMEFFGSTGESLTASQPNFLPQPTAVSCAALPESLVPTKPRACVLAVNLDGKGPSTLTLTAAVQGWTQQITFSYSTIQPTISATVPATSFAEESGAPMSVNVKDDKGAAISAPGGLVVKWESKGTPGGVLAPADANGNYSLAGLRAATYTISAAFASSGSYAAATLASPLTLTITGPALLTPEPSTLTAKSGVPLSFSVTAKTKLGAVCTGSISFTPPDLPKQTSAVNADGRAPFTIKVGPNTPLRALKPLEIDYTQADKDPCSTPSTQPTFQYAVVP